MLKRENELRKWDNEIQEKFRIAEQSIKTDWMDVALEIQKQVCNEFGIGAHQMNDGLYQLRLAALRHPDLALYVRFNRCTRGTLELGAPCPNILVNNLKGDERCLLHENIGNSRKLVILAGSYS